MRLEKRLETVAIENQWGNWPLEVLKRKLEDSITFIRALRHVNKEDIAKLKLSDDANHYEDYLRSGGDFS